MFAKLGISRFNRMFSHALQVGIGWAAESLWVGKGFGKIGLGEAEEIFFINFPSLFLAH